ncbi:MAG: hypothetical protein L0H64_10570 [Pseudonocardia sp.]|nr:hypothetical protein [Pseudonocardia sp.]
MPYGTAVERRVDLALLGDRIFVSNASLGVYATVVQSEAYRDAKLATTAQVLPDLLGPGVDRSDLRYPGPDGEPTRHCCAVRLGTPARRTHGVTPRG